MMEGSKQDDADSLLWPSLRLLVPPIRVMSAVMWRIIQHRDVLQYGMLADFVSLVTEAVPELFSSSCGVKLILGLRAKLILELCRSNDPVDIQAIQPHLNSIQLSLPLVKYGDNMEVEETGVHFAELVHTLMKDTNQREHFHQNVFPVEFGPSFDSSIQTLMWDFLFRLEQFLPVPDLLQTVGWLTSDSSALKDCEESISNPDNLRSLLHHHKCLGHLNNCASSMSLSTGDCILSALSGNKDKVDQMSTDELDPPENSVSTEIPVCVMDGTDVETVVVMSEWSEIELESNHVVEEPSEDSGNPPHLSESEQKESQSSESIEKSQLRSDKDSNMEGYLEESPLNHKEDDHPSDDSKQSREDENLCPEIAEPKQLYCHQEKRHAPNNSSTRSKLIVSAGAAKEPANIAIPIATRRSARKSKKTWKIKLVNLQKQKRKTVASKVGNSQKRERGPIAPTRNSGTITDEDEEALTLNERDSSELSASPSILTSDGNADTSSKKFSCPQCSFTHVQERYVKSHLKKIHPVVEPSDNEPHVCKVCGKGFRYPGMLKSHQRRHTGEQPFQCMASRCGRRFSYMQALRRHRLVHNPKKSLRKKPDEALQQAELETKERPQNNEPRVYNCLYCSESFSSLTARCEHYKSHPEEELKRCSDCGKILSCQAALIRHKRGHNEPTQIEQPHICPLCNSSFSCTTSFKRHALTHQPERPYRCSCGKGFTYKGALLSHQRIHTAEKSYQCSHCNKCFFYPGELRKHERTHSQEKPYLCPHCGKSFKRERILRAHVAGHTEEKIFKCSVCDKTFAYKASWARHVLTHTGERPYLCSDCGKTFFSFGELMKHQRFHTGEKPFQCSYCDKSFTQACYLQLHTRYHTGVRPYMCPQCSKSFFTSCRLKRHMQIHTDYKPHECAECGKKFRQAYVLKVHRRTHLEKDLKG
ncbi:C2H2-type zinc finger protein [Trichomycterus rosablanca]|uniref:C2H2-type zinc finger protein n=1 Tax=Trichomycterus rosablanca TaxID=2290929 RepID=UPI002F355646